MVLHGSVMFDRIAGGPIQIDRVKLLLRYQASEKRTVRKALTVATSSYPLRNRERPRGQGNVPERSTGFDQVMVSVSVMLWLNADEPEPTVPVTVRG